MFDLDLATDINVDIDVDVMVLLRMHVLNNFKQCEAAARHRRGCGKALDGNRLIRVLAEFCGDPCQVRGVTETSSQDYRMKVNIFT